MSLSQPSSPLSAILVAAGSSRRMGFDKLAAILKGKSVLAHSFSALMNCNEISEIIVVAAKERADLLDPQTFTKPVIFVEGGTERYHSVAAGLNAISPNSKFVAIHDAARPFLSQTDLLSVIQQAKEHSAATLARRVTETLKQSDLDDFTSGSITRDALWFIETPQVFRVDLIQAAYQFIIENDIIVTDETSALQAIGGKTKLVASTTPNPKITTPSDLTLSYLIG